MIESMLVKYNINNSDDYHRAIKEIMQEIALAGLYRSGFFEKAAFYGGTALRIFHGVDRFSEGLDFSLLTDNNDFLLDPYFAAIVKEFSALGIEVQIEKKNKTKKTAIQSAFLKSNTHVHDLTLKGVQSRKWTTSKPVKIRFEVDTMPPGNFETEELLLLQPFSFYVKCFRLPDLFAGKLHELLYRGWKNRVKGRDWYDFEWYVRHAHPVSLKHFLARAQQTGAFDGVETLTIDMLRQALHTRVDEVDFEQAKADVKPYLSNVDGLEIWSEDYFQQLVNKVVDVSS
ncbi:hypothetical protein AB833_06165 [Chromatiales bacterium (ex Bugula neritina AB1)]|nr:hypothetical protein AB833_06165 [Chromatiales bacterium (ex Bugula neritina AB1)]